MRRGAHARVQNQPLAPPLLLSRRRVLAAMGATAAVGIGATALRGDLSDAALAHSDAVEGSATIRAATMWNDKLVGLAGIPDQHVYVHSLNLESSRRVVLGERLPIELPHDFHPWAIAATEDRIWISGAMGYLFEVVTVDNRIETVPIELREMAGEGDPSLPNAIIDYEVWRFRPTLMSFDGKTLEEVDIPVPGRIGWGATTGIATGDDGTVAVAIDGCPDPDASIVTRSHIAVSTNGGRTWTERLLDSSLKEGFATALTIVDRELVVATVDGEGTRKLRMAPVESTSALETIETRYDAAPVTALVPSGDGVIVFGAGKAGIEVDVYGSTGAGVARDQLEGHCGCESDMAVAVNGMEEKWIIVAQEGAKLGG